MPERLNAKDLLYLLLDYFSFWNRDEVKVDKPSAIRRQQILSLSSALNIFNVSDNSEDSKPKLIDQSEHWDALFQNRYLDYLKHGRFIHLRPAKSYQPVQDQLYQHLEYLKEKKGLPKSYKPSSIYMEYVFDDLFNFRLKVFSLFRDYFTSDGSFSLERSFYKSKKKACEESLKEDIEKIDQILCLILDPARQQIPLSTLMNLYQFPDVNPGSLDSDWAIGNWIDDD
ncbi:MAG: hypothetical protein ACNS62_25515 [Candidatus Cyclobacteriaceae bacterium M3_2C_046]